MVALVGVGNVKPACPVRSMLGDPRKRINTMRCVHDDLAPARGRQTLGRFCLVNYVVECRVVSVSELFFFMPEVAFGRERAAGACPSSRRRLRMTGHDVMR